MLINFMFNPHLYADTGYAAKQFHKPFKKFTC